MKVCFSFIVMLFLASGLFGVGVGTSSSSSSVNNNDVLEIEFTETTSGWKYTIPLLIKSSDDVIYTGLFYHVKSGESPKIDPETGAFITNTGEDYIIEIRAEPSIDIKEKKVLPSAKDGKKLFDNYDLKTVQFMHRKNKEEEWSIEERDNSAYSSSGNISDMFFLNMKEGVRYVFKTTITPKIDKEAKNE